MKMKMQCLSALLVVLGCALTLPRATAQNAYFYIVHAAPGRNVVTAVPPLLGPPSPMLPVDLSVNGQCVAREISYGDIAGPLSGPAGVSTVIFTQANSTAPCSGVPVFSGQVNTTVGTTYYGVLSVNTAGKVFAQIYAANFSPVPVGVGRIELINATSSTLKVTFGTNGPFSLAPNSLNDFNAPPGTFSSSVLDANGLRLAGPANLQVLQRDLYIYVLAGSTTNKSVQSFGPKAIPGIF